MTVYEVAGKRLFDIASSLAAIVVLSPVLLLTALAIKVEDGGPAIFQQKRVGKGGGQFTLVKFRSMLVETPNVPSAQLSGLRVTKIGAFIRRTNIDELPQLFNILLGDMSVVGPRPALPSQQSLLEGRAQAGVPRLRPGLTGLAQVNSYDGMPDIEKVEWERRYGERITFFGDIAIIFWTVGYLFRRPPVY